jgi:hypothetical protein
MKAITKTPHCLGVVAHACSPSTQEAEAGGAKFKASLGYRDSVWSRPTSPQTQARHKLVTQKQRK